MAEEVIPDQEAIPFAEFLESTAPGKMTRVSGLFTWVTNHALGVATPDIQLHCDSPQCSGVRFFFGNRNREVSPTHACPIFLNYNCRNCGKQPKLFALVTTRKDIYECDGEVIKLGELPFFGPPLPSRVISLVGPDRDLFILGRRAENLGLGIGAFAYYRRIVENQKGRLIGEIAKVAARLGASQENIDRLAAAQKEPQFSKAIEEIKHAIPAVLFINGHNPLTLLHTALSQGIHDSTEEECLAISISIRLILTELAERISTALKDEAELKAAVTHLLTVKKAKT